MTPESCSYPIVLAACILAAALFFSIFLCSLLIVFIVNQRDSSDERSVPIRDNERRH